MLLTSSPGPLPSAACVLGFGAEVLMSRAESTLADMVGFSERSGLALGAFSVMGGAEKDEGTVLRGEAVWWRRMQEMWYAVTRIGGSCEVR